jgi:hypothetical protein
MCIRSWFKHDLDKYTDKDPVDRQVRNQVLPRTSRRVIAFEDKKANDLVELT